jgi:hypothetical protein
VKRADARPEPDEPRKQSGDQMSVSTKYPGDQALSFVEMTDDDLRTFMRARLEEGYTEDTFFPNRTAHAARAFHGPKAWGRIHIHFAGCCGKHQHVVTYTPDKPEEER